MSFTKLQGVTPAFDIHFFHVFFFSKQKFRNIKWKNRMHFSFSSRFVDCSEESFLCFSGTRVFINLVEKTTVRMNCSRLYNKKNKTPTPSYRCILVPLPPYSKVTIRSKFKGKLTAKKKLHLKQKEKKKSINILTNFFFFSLFSETTNVSQLCSYFL